MESFVALLGIVAVLFAWTNLDDLFVLLGFFSDPRVRARHVIVGQYMGIAVLYGVSVFASLLSIVVARAYIGLLGLAPIIIGITKLYSLWRGAGTDEDRRDDHAVASARAGRNILRQRWRQHRRLHASICDPLTCGSRGGWGGVRHHDRALVSARLLARPPSGAGHANSPLWLSNLAVPVDQLWNLDLVCSRYFQPALTSVLEAIRSARRAARYRDLRALDPRLPEVR